MSIATGLCRFCKQHDVHSNLVQYAPRHNAHFRCFVEAGKPLSSLTAHQVGQFPAKLLREKGLIDEAHRILDAENARRAARGGASEAAA